MRKNHRTSVLGKPRSVQVLLTENEGLNDALSALVLGLLVAANNDRWLARGLHF